MEVAADRLSIRWFLGYDLDEPLPDHSSLTRIRERYGLVHLQGLLRRDRRDVPRGGFGPG
jgi:IS5 family transposase